MASSCEYPSRFLKQRAAGNTEVKRGEAILISMVKYPKEGRERSGAAADMGRLETLFSTLCFNVFKYVDKEAKGLKNTVIDISTTKPEETSDCFVCFVSAHGNIDERGHYIEAIDANPDNKVYIYDDILKPLMTCGALEGIPKVFFIDSCRGEYSKKQNQSRESVVDYIKTAGKDSVVVFSTEEGNESWRDPDSGTYFVQALCDVIIRNHEKEDVISMATMANKMIIRNTEAILKVKKKGPKYQVAPTHSNLTGKLFWRTQDPSESSAGQAKNVGNVIVGQDLHREKLKNWLLSRETEGKSVAGGLKSQSFVISGTGGVGKTTLAKSLFEDEYIKYFFDHRVYWVTLKRNPKIVKRQRRLISKICNEMPSMKFDTPTLLLEELKRKLSKMRSIFLIIDDVWEKEDVDKLLGDPFLSTLPPGSKCIITSRKPAGLEKLDKNIQVEKLDVLNELDAKKLFCSKAFLSETLPTEQPLRAVVEEVIDACGKMPILLATIGAGQWGIRYIESWLEVRDRLKHITDENRSDEAVYQKLIKQLMISYDDLPDSWDFGSGDKISLKECFLDFAAFTEQEEIEISVLMDLWSKPGLTEDEMYKILEELEQRCLVKMDGYWCRVHDIFRTLAVRIVQAPRLKERKRLFAWELSTSRLPEEWEISLNVRSGDSEDDFETEKMVIAKSELKTFHPSDAILFRCMTHLRMLFLTSNLNLVLLPPEIGYMKCLEKLDLSWCLGLERLPREIGQLESLEKLNMAGCSSLTEIPAEVGKLKKLLELNMQSCGIEELPVEIGELTRLTYLCLNDCHRLKVLPEAMGKLSSLERLECDMLQIMEIPKSLGDLSKLKYVSFTACGAITEIPAEFVKLKNVISFCFEACHRLVTVPTELDQLTNHCLAVFNVSKTRVMIQNLPPSLRELQDIFQGNSRDANDESEAEGNLKMQGLQMRGVLVDPTSVFHPNSKEERRASFGLARIISMVKTEPFLSPRFDMAIRLMYTMANLDGTRHAIVRSGGLPVLLRCIDKGDFNRCGLYAAATLRNICMTYSTHKAVVDAGALSILTRVLNRKNDIRFYAYQTLTQVINGDVAEGDYVFTSEIYERCGHSFWKCNRRCIYCVVEQQFEDPDVKAGLKS